MSKDGIRRSMSNVTNLESIVLILLAGEKTKQASEKVAGKIAEKVACVVSKGWLRISRSRW